MFVTLPLLWLQLKENKLVHPSSVPTCIWALTVLRVSSFVYCGRMLPLSSMLLVLPTQHRSRTAATAAAAGGIRTIFHMISVLCALCCRLRCMHLPPSTAFGVTEPTCTCLGIAHPVLIHAALQVLIYHAPDL